MDFKLCFLLIGLFAISHVLAEDAPASSEDSKEVPPSVASAAAATPAASVEPAKTENKTTAIHHDMDYQSDEAAPTVAPVAVNTSSTMPPLEHSSQKMHDEDKPTTEPSLNRIGSSSGIVTEAAAKGATEATKTSTTLPAGGKKAAGHKSGSDFLRGSFVLASLCLIFAKAVQ